MRAQFTQQLLVGSELYTFLFTENSISEEEPVFIIRVLNNEEIKPFSMYMIDGHFEIMNENVPISIRDIRFLLNQAIQNYYTMQALLKNSGEVNNLSRFTR